MSSVCSLSNVVIKTFHLYKTDILMSLCCFPDFLSSLWRLVYTEHSQSSRTLARNMATEETTDPFVPLLLLFCSCFGQYFVVLSDSEIYEQEQPFSLKQLGTIGDFVNSMLFNIVWNHYDELKNATGTVLFIDSQKLKCHFSRIVTFPRQYYRVYSDHYQLMAACYLPSNPSMLERTTSPQIPSML